MLVFVCLIKNFEIFCIWYERWNFVGSSSFKIFFILLVMFFGVFWISFNDVCVLCDIILSFVIFFVKILCFLVFCSECSLFFVWEFYFKINIKSGGVIFWCFVGYWWSFCKGLECNFWGKRSFGNVVIVGCFYSIFDKCGVWVWKGSCWMFFW